MSVAGRVRGLLERVLARRREAADGVADAELLARFVRDRAEDAFELLVWRHGGMVFGVCRRALRDEQFAEDAFQAVFLVLARKAASVRGNLGGWLFKVARRVATRAAARQPNPHPLPELPAAEHADSLERDELAALLDAEVARLPERLRRPVVLCYLGGRSTEDAARELGCPRGTVLSRLAAARARLAARLTRRGVTLPAALSVPTLALTGRVVSSATALARQFRIGAFAAGPAAYLAEGVIRSMTRTALATAFSGTLVAAALVSGVGWVAANQRPKTETAADQPPAPAKPKAEPPVPNPKPDADAARKALDDKLKQLEKLSAALQQEIDTQERNIALVAKENEAAIRAAELARKRLDEADSAFAAVSRDLDKLNAEATVLKKLLDAKKPLVEPDPAAIEQAVAKNAQVISHRAHVDRCRVEYTLALGRTGEGAANPASKELKAKLDRSEEEYRAVEKLAREQALELHRTSTHATLRERLAKVTTDMAIQTEIRERLREEHDNLSKAIAGGAAGAVHIASLRQTLAPQRDALDAVQRQLIRLRLQRDGLDLPPAADATATKLDLLIREVSELRKEVRELKNPK